MHRLGNPDDWMEHRIGLFDKFCFPSVEGQSNQNFIWWILCDPDTKPEFKDQLKKFERDNIIFSLWATDPFKIELDKPGWGAFRKKVNEEASDYDVVMTTRLDNDDALHVDYVDTIQGRILEHFNKSSHESMLINFKKGYKLDTKHDQLYRTHMLNNPFQTLIELGKNHIRTVLGLGNHSTAHERCFTYQDEALMWMEVLHARNIWNRIIHGDVKVPIKGLEGKFKLNEYPR